jgi:hypothetical protein
MLTVFIYYCVKHVLCNKTVELVQGAARCRHLKSKNCQLLYLSTPVFFILLLISISANEKVAIKARNLI